MNANITVDVPAVPFLTHPIPGMILMPHAERHDKGADGNIHVHNFVELFTDRSKAMDWLAKHPNCLKKEITVHTVDPQS